jgi:nitroimidazol reductase NimA-like FMN-containing flavoprotein (pyridoxamine 5'-phosphate oxidase superfamily)
MIVHELTAAECRDILTRTNLGRLACARYNQPYIVPIFFSFDPDANCLYGFSTVGKKIEWMRENPRVCVEVEEIADQFHWATVVITGRYVEVRNADKAQAARERAKELFQQRPQWWLPGGAKLATGVEHDESVIYGIEIDALSGRRASKPE